MNYQEFQTLCNDMNIKERVGEWNFLMIKKNAQVEYFNKEVGKCLTFIAMFKQDFIGAGSFRTWMKAPIDVN